MVYKIPPGGGGKPYLASGLNFGIKNCLIIIFSSPEPNAHKVSL